MEIIKNTILIKYPMIFSKKMKDTISYFEWNILSELVVQANHITDTFNGWNTAFIEVQAHMNNTAVHVSPLDREKWDGMLPKDGSEPMEGDLNLGGNYLDYAKGIWFEQGGLITNSNGNDITIYLPNGQVFFRFNQDGLNMFLRKLTDVAKGVNSKDGANMENINDQLPRDGSRPMQGNLNMAYKSIKNVSHLYTTTINLTEEIGNVPIFITNDIDLTLKRIKNVGQLETLSIDGLQGTSDEILVKRGLYMYLNKISGLANGTDEADAATIKNIIDYILSHNTSGVSHADIRAEINALQGAFVYRGRIALVNEDVTETALNNRLFELMERTPMIGDVLIDNDEHEWYFNGTTWNDMGQGIIALASTLNDGLMSKEHYTKLESLRSNEQNDDRYIQIEDLDAPNVNFNGSGTNYLVGKIDVEGAVKELDTQLYIIDHDKANKTEVETLLGDRYTKAEVLSLLSILDERIDRLEGALTWSVNLLELIDSLCWTDTCTGALETDLIDALCWTGTCENASSSNLVFSLHWT